MFVTVASYLDPLEAHIVLGRLRAEGLDGYVADYHQVIADWNWRLALGGAKVRVRRGQAAEAQQLLAAIAAGEFLPEGELPVRPALARDTASVRLAYFALFVLQLPLPWRRRVLPEVDDIGDGNGIDIDRLA
jgi:hypothetical protein